MTKRPNGWRMEESNEEGWNEGGRGERGKQQKYSSFLLCELVYLWHQMNFVETISLSGEHLATETVRRQRKSYRVRSARTCLLFVFVRKKNNSSTSTGTSHRAAHLMRI